MNFRFAKDKWLSQEFTFVQSGLLSYDKFQHFLGGAAFSLVVTIFADWIVGLISSMLFWFIWEIKDGFLDYENGYFTDFPIRYNWGGDGFSWKDMLAAWAGAGLILIMGLLII